MVLKPTQIKEQNKLKSLEKFIDSKLVLKGAPINSVSIHLNYLTEVDRNEWENLLVKYKESGWKVKRIDRGTFGSEKYRFKPL